MRGTIFSIGFYMFIVGNISLIVSAIILFVGINTVGYSEYLISWIAGSALITVGSLILWLGVLTYDWIDETVNDNHNRSNG